MVLVKFGRFIKKPRAAIKFAEKPAITLFIAFTRTKNFHFNIFQYTQYAPYRLLASVQLRRYTCAGNG